MSRRKSQPTPFDDPLVVLLTILALIILFAPWEWKVVLILTGLLIGLCKWHFGFRVSQEQLRGSGIEIIDKMSGKEFEQRLWRLFVDLGYTVEPTPYSKDWGADLVLRRDGICTVVQAKRSINKITPNAVQEIVGAKAKYGATGAMVVTNSYYTAGARELARANMVTLWDRTDLMRALIQAGELTKRISHNKY